MKCFRSVSKESTFRLEALQKELDCRPTSGSPGAYIPVAKAISKLLQTGLKYSDVTPEQMQEEYEKDIQASTQKNDATQPSSDRQSSGNESTSSHTQSSESQPKAQLEVVVEDDEDEVEDEDEDENEVGDEDEEEEEEEEEEEDGEISSALQLRGVELDESTSLDDLLASSSSSRSNSSSDAASPSDAASSSSSSSSEIVNEEGDAKMVDSASEATTSTQTGIEKCLKSIESALELTLDECNGKSQKIETRLAGDGYPVKGTYLVKLSLTLQAVDQIFRKCPKNVRDALKQVFPVLIVEGQEKRDFMSPHLAPLARELIQLDGQRMVVIHPRTKKLFWFEISFKYTFDLACQWELSGLSKGDCPICLATKEERLTTCTPLRDKYPDPLLPFCPKSFIMCILHMQMRIASHFVELLTIQNLFVNEKFVKLCSVFQDKGILYEVSTC
jgi:hypothetical protein